MFSLKPIFGMLSNARGISLPHEFLTSVFSVIVALICSFGFFVHLFLFYDIYTDMLYTLQRVALDNTFLLCIFCGLSIYLYLSSDTQICLDTSSTLLLLRYAACSFFTLFVLSLWIIYSSDKDVQAFWNTSALKQDNSLKLQFVTITCTLAYLILMLACAVEDFFFKSNLPLAEPRKLEVSGLKVTS